jgi:hypothetical protein
MQRNYWGVQTKGIIIIYSKITNRSALPTNQRVAYPEDTAMYCSVFGRLETHFRLVIGFINNVQVSTTFNYYTIADLHHFHSLQINLLSLSAVVFT